MELRWESSGYVLGASSPREDQLIRDALVESLYIVERLPEQECVARLGKRREGLQDIIDNWGDFCSDRHILPIDLEVIKNCFIETLYFFSDSEYQMRTGYLKADALIVFEGIMMDRKRVTILRQWE